MSWIEVKAEFENGLDLSPFVDIFLEYGIENTLEEGSTLTGCLVSVEGSAERIGELAEALKEAGAVKVETRDLVEDNWEIAWRQFFKPRRIGKRFLVRPTWEEFESDPNDLVIVLDPGQAFGTGDHPTTRLCLELMEQPEVAGKRVIDIGCGSGILSIGACLLGASEVLAMVADEALQIHGGMGLMSDLPLERIWRDARIERIWEGTSEIQRHIISRSLLRPLGG
jgi:ribosomal protein L11 methyltransferase